MPSKSSNSKLLTLSFLAAVPILMFVGSLLWWLRMPELMSYQEQYQLFLFNTSYFTERISEAGGLADWMGEFVTQFFYAPTAGAVMAATVFTLLQVIIGAICYKSAAAEASRLALYALSCLPSIILMYFFGDENLLMSLPCALLIVEVVTLIILLPTTGKFPHFIGDSILGFIVAYWLAGPVALLLPIQYISLKRNFTKRWVWFIPIMLTCAALICLIWHFWYRQYPLSQLFCGLNYYRIPYIFPSAIYLPPISIIAISLLGLIKTKRGAKTQDTRGSDVIIGVSTLAAVAIAAIVLVPKGYDEEKMELLRYDYLVRNERWHDIIEQAMTKPPRADFALQALNLALGKTGQMGNLMFEFPQHGIGGLIAKYQRDNTTCLISAETFYHLGMVNSAFRYNFDLQEAIMNDRKSGRFLKRMAQCLIINGKYKVAAKYLDLLKGSLYYDSWARDTEKLLVDEEKINQHPDYGEKRKIRFKQEMLYNYPGIEKMLGLLAIESEGRNLLAWDYFNAATLLKGDLHTMTGMYHYGNDTFRLSSIPKHHQEAIAMFWTFGHPDFEGIPYPISDEVKQNVAALAQAVMRAPNNPSAWAQQFAGNYCVYFLRSQMQKQASAQEETIKASARGE